MKISQENKSNEKRQNEKRCEYSSKSKVSNPVESKKEPRSIQELSDDIKTSRNERNDYGREWNFFSLRYY